MSLLTSIKTTLTNDLHILETDAHELASKLVSDAETTFSSVLDKVLEKAKSRPIGEILEGVYGIYKELKSGQSGQADGTTTG